jgi:hypothetical protein
MAASHSKPNAGSNNQHHKPCEGEQHWVSGGPQPPLKMQSGQAHPRPGRQGSSETQHTHTHVEHKWSTLTSPTPGG